MGFCFHISCYQNLRRLGLTEVLHFRHVFPTYTVSLLGTRIQLRLPAVKHLASFQRRQLRCERVVQNDRAKFIRYLQQKKRKRDGDAKPRQEKMAAIMNDSPLGAAQTTGRALGAQTHMCPSREATYMLHSEVANLRP